MPAKSPLRFALFLAGCLSATLLAGCATGIEMSASAPAPLAMSSASGRSGKLHSGDHQAYWLWQDEDKVWHLRVTSARVAHHFEGRIRPLTGAAIAELKIVRLERNNFCQIDGRDIVFNFSTRGHEDGFDFRVAGSACLEFDLRIDHDGDPGHIFIGDKQVRPEKAHFVLCP